MVNKLRRFEEDSKWLDEHYDELNQEYEKEWVAVFNKEVVDHDKNLDRLLGRLEGNYPEEFREMVIEFITKEKLEMIL